MFLKRQHGRCNVIPHSGLSLVPKQCAGVKLVFKPVVFRRALFVLRRLFKALFCVPPFQTSDGEHQPPHQRVYRVGTWPEGVRQRPQADTGKQHLAFDTGTEHVKRTLRGDNILKTIRIQL